MFKLIVISDEDFAAVIWHQKNRCTDEIAMEKCNGYSAFNNNPLGVGALYFLKSTSEP